ncbi:MAG TPA: transcription termination/antitermination protein NusG [Candidatus Bathyarchaeia archaeon]|nr:transcription termination/antitermination protein NusG [Candidatus Bathyarchaeia archaeon]
MVKTKAEPKPRLRAKARIKTAKKTKKKAGPRQPEPGHIVIKKSSHKNAAWYVVHTYSGHEAKVAEQLRQRVESMGLEDKILEILIPTQDKIQIRSGKKETTKEKIFPGYMLVKIVLTDQSWLTVRTTPGITGFVGSSTKPTPLETAEVQAIQKFSEIKAPKFKAKFSLGEAIKIIDGPFADFLGTVDKIDEAKGKLKVLVSIFGRETPVELDFLQVAKI